MNGRGEIFYIFGIDAKKSSAEHIIDPFCTNFATRSSDEFRAICSHVFHNNNKIVYFV
jgi:hypothetical protein